MNFSPCGEALQEIITKNQPSVPYVNPYAIPSFGSTPKRADLLRMKKENQLSHKQKTRKNKKIEKSKGYFEQQEFKQKQQKKVTKKKDKKPPTPEETEET